MRAWRWGGVHVWRAVRAWRGVRARQGGACVAIQISGDAEPGKTWALTLSRTGSVAASPAEERRDLIPPVKGSVLRTDCRNQVRSREPVRKCLR